MPRNILVIGHSHIDAIRRAAVVRREADPDRHRTRTIHLLDQAFASEMNQTGDRFSSEIEAEIRSQIQRHQPIIASVIGGNAHSALVLIPRRPLDFVLSDDDALPIEQGVEIISEAEAREMMTNALQPEFLRMRLLMEIAGPFWQLESPPPIRNAEWMMQHPENLFVDHPDFHILGFAPAGIRYRMWRLATRIIRAEMTRMGCGYVPVPAYVCGAAGLLRPSQARDATHGNMHFGEAMIQELERLAG